MSGNYTISQLAKAGEVPTSTLRYYERVGLLKPEPRTAGDYRRYTDDSLRRLRFIRAAQATGFTLDDVRALLGNPQGSNPQCRDVQGLIEARLTEVRRRMADLRHVQRVLRTALKECQATDLGNGCHVVDALQHD